MLLFVGCENTVKLIPHYKEERRCKGSSETSNLGAPEIDPHLEPTLEGEDPGPPVTAEEEGDVEASIPELQDVTTSGEEQERRHVVPEQNVTRKTLPPGQSCARSLASGHCKRKDMELELEKMNSLQSENFSRVCPQENGENTRNSTKRN